MGRLNEQKGYEYLIDAWTIVSKRHPDWILNAYGSGEIKEQLQMRIDEKGVSNSLILNDPTSDIIDKYLESSIYIMSSRFEGFPMVLLEAMSCGLPCVSFDCPNGAKDLIVDGKNGFLVDYLNIERLADRICDLIENDFERKRMGRTAKEEVKKYLPDAVMFLWGDVFSKMSVAKRKQ